MENFQRGYSIVHIANWTVSYCWSIKWSTYSHLMILLLFKRRKSTNLRQNSAVTSICLSTLIQGNFAANLLLRLRKRVRTLPKLSCLLGPKSANLLVLVLMPNWLSLCVKCWRYGFETWRVGSVRNQPTLKFGIAQLIPGVADSSLPFTIISIGVPIQRELMDYHCLAVLKNSVFYPKSIFILENVNLIGSQIK